MNEAQFITMHKNMTVKCFILQVPVVCTVNKSFVQLGLNEADTFKSG